jgi:signal transduction histidine kinase
VWAGLLEGAVRVEHPEVEEPTFVRYTVENGLSSNIVSTFVEDALGNIFIGTNQGIDRLHVASGAVRHYGVADGLPANTVLAARADHRGVLWFGSSGGLSRLLPTPDPPPVPPDVFISAVHVGGRLRAGAELGTRSVVGLTLGPSENHLQIDYFALPRGSVGPIRYQYRLDDSPVDWSPPTDRRSMLLASMAAGRYRLSVRALSPMGVESARPATVSFTVLPPVYARWWFIGLGLLVAGAVPLTAYRFRVAQLIRLERIRSRIATDLHDDIGSGLSLVAILAEVVRQRAGGTRSDPDLGQPLTRIAETSRALVDSMDDIVWAINPEHDTVSDFVQHVRRFSGDVLGSGEIDLVFETPETLPDAPLGPDVRREVFLILKESVTNIAKHAGATRVEIDFAYSRHHLHLRVSDNGRGFDVAGDSDGDGLVSMRRRVAALGGRLAIQSTPGQGTTIALDVERRRFQRFAGLSLLPRVVTRALRRD